MRRSLLVCLVCVALSFPAAGEAVEIAASHPLEPLSALEMKTAFEIVKARFTSDPNLPDKLRFPMLVLSEPPKREWHVRAITGHKPQWGVWAEGQLIAQGTMDEAWLIARHAAHQAGGQAYLHFRLRDGIKQYEDFANPPNRGKRAPLPPLICT